MTPDPLPDAPARYSAAWYGCHTLSTTTPTRVLELERARVDGRGTPLGGTETVQVRYGVCADCGEEYRLTPGGLGPQCPVNHPTYLRRVADARRRAGVA